jgi:spermidine/putrescine transport system permease protein
LIERLKKSFFNEFPFFVATPAILWPFAVFIFPLCCFIVTSFFDYDLGVFSLQYYYYIFNAIGGRIVFRSLCYATLTTLFTLLIGYPVAYYVAFYVKSKEYLLFFLTLPFWTNLIVLVYSWFFLLEREGLINLFLIKFGLISEPLQLAYTHGSVVLLMTYCYLPFMIMPIYTVLHKLNIRLLEASYDLGATYSQTLLRVILPLSLSGIRTGIILVFVPAFGEFIIPALMGGAKHLTVGSLISYYFVISQNYVVGSAFTIFSGLILMFVTIGFYSCIKLLVNKRN